MRSSSSCGATTRSSQRRALAAACAPAESTPTPGGKPGLAAAGMRLQECALSAGAITRRALVDAACLPTLHACCPSSQCGLPEACGHQRPRGAAGACSRLACMGCSGPMACVVPAARRSRGQRAGPAYLGAAHAAPPAQPCWSPVQVLGGVFSIDDLTGFEITKVGLGTCSDAVQRAWQVAADRTRLPCLQPCLPSCQ